MNQRIANAYMEILKYELVPALGCTEPGAIAFSTAKLRNLLGQAPEHLDITCSGNVVKNVKGVTVPNSGGLRGIEAAAVLGSLIVGDKEELEILEHVSPDEVKAARKLIGTGYCNCFLKEGEEGLYIQAVAKAGQNEGEIIIKDHHTNIIFLRKNETVLQNTHMETKSSDVDRLKEMLHVKDIIRFATEGDYSQIKDLLQLQVTCNMQIAEEGLRGYYGAEVGKTLMETDGTTVETRARAKAAAGSDARMGGCSFPVVVNSGSGNQGITVTVPVVEYARELKVSEDKLYRAMILSNLIAIHIKRYIGTLSAFCGAVSAGCASGAAITFLYGGDYRHIASTIINTLGNVSGVLCDGAKSSCAAKIASSVEAAIMAHHMTMRHRQFQYGEGVVMEDVEQTIKNIGHIGKKGMRETDLEILHIMMNEKEPCSSEKQS